MADRNEVILPPDNRFCMSNSYHLAICNRDETAAKIINFFCNCPARYRNGNGIEISIAHIIGALQYTCSKNTVVKALRWLNDSRMITSKKSSTSTSSYTVNFNLIQSKVDEVAQLKGGATSILHVKNDPIEMMGDESESPETMSELTKSSYGIEATDTEDMTIIDHDTRSELTMPLGQICTPTRSKLTSTRSKLTPINILYREQDVLVDLAEDKTLNNTSNGSVTTTPLTTVAEAPLTSVAYAPSLAIEKEKFEESAIETTSAIITSSPSQALEIEKMNTTDVLTEIFIRYAKVPEKKRDAKCKGSASRLMQNWGDKLKPVVEEIGEEALVAMENFIRDEYWLAKGLPLPAFKSQYRKYLSAEEPESPDQSETRTELKPAKKFQSSAASGYQTPQFNYTDHHPIAVFSLQDQSGATLRKREALDILQHVGGDLEAAGRAAIGFKIDDTMHAAVEEWHSKALQAYKSIKHRDYPVLTSPIREVR